MRQMVKETVVCPVDKLLQVLTASAAGHQKFQQYLRPTSPLVVHLDCQRAVAKKHECANRLKVQLTDRR
jgi:hypothetical protein